MATNTSERVSVVGAKQVDGKFKIGVKVKGTFAVSKKLTGSVTTSQAKKSVKYQWLRDGKAISKATKKSYKLVAADIGHNVALRATVTPKNKQYATKAAISTSSLVPKAKSTTKVAKITAVKVNKSAKAKVTVAATGVRPAGLVRVYVNNKLVSQATLTTAKKGKITITLPSFTAKGTYSIKAVYIDSTTKINGSTSKVVKAKAK
jgi:hypothetical protein